MQLPCVGGKCGGTGQPRVLTPCLFLVPPQGGEDDSRLRAFQRFAAENGIRVRFIHGYDNLKLLLETEALRYEALVADLVDSGGLLQQHVSL